MTPRPKVMVQQLISEMLSNTEEVIPSLELLKKIRLIEFSNRGTPYVKLTLLGRNIR